MGRTRDLMATAAVRGVLTAIRRSDADLLRRFAAGRDDAAFAELVRRHGPLVLGVCRRVVADRHLADDAFQAAFVVLANKAGGLDAGRPLGPWLYGVAFRVALRARLMIGRRRKRETLTATVPEVVARAVAPDDLSAVVDEEINRLSAVCREAVVLCEMQGLSRKEAAARLGVAEGTLSSRLAAARKTLAGRLRKRGVTLGGGIFSATLVPTDLLAATVAMSTGKVELSTHIVKLVEGATHMALLSKLKLAAVATAVVLLSAGGFGVWPGGESSAAPVPKEIKDEGLLWVYDPPAGELTAFTPDGNQTKKVKLHDETAATGAFYGISEDGQFALFGGVDGKFPEKGWDYDTIRRGKLTLHRKQLYGDGPVTDTGVVVGFSNRFVTAPDGGILHSRNVAPLKDPPPAGVREYVTTRYDAAGKNPEKLDLPDSMHLCAALPAGGYVAESYHQSEAPHHRHWMCRPGEEPVRISGDRNLESAAVSPDGRSLLGTQYRTQTTEPGQETFTLVVMDAASGEHRRIDGYEGTAFVRGFWSPDGRRIAVQWNKREEGKPLDKWGQTWQGGAGEVAVYDPDGTHRRLVLKLDDPGEGVHSVAYTRHLLGWFPDARKRNAPVPKEKDDPGLIWTHNAKTGELTAYTPDGKKAKELTLKDGKHFLGFTQDGKRILFAGKGGKLADDGDTDGLTLHLRDVSDKADGTDTGLGLTPRDQVVLSPDGKQIVRQRLDNISGRGPRKHEYSHVLFDVATRKETPIDLPTDHQIMQWSADGKTWRVLHSNLGDDPKLPNYRWLTTPAGDKPDLKPICDAGSFNWLEADAGEKTALAAGVAHPAAGGVVTPCLFRVAGGKADVVTRFDGVAYVNLRLSPDGKRVACAKYEYDAQARAAGGTVLAVFDADGRNEVKLFTAPNDGQNTHLLGWFPTKPADARKRNTPVPKAAPPEGVFLVGKLSHKEPGKILEVLDTAGKSRGYLPVGELMNVQQVRVSPDGTRLAFVRFIPLKSTDKKGQYAYPQDVYVVDLPLTAPPTEPVIKGVVEPTVAWAADGKSLFVSSIPADTNLDQDGIKGQMIPKKTVRYDVAAKTETAVELPQWHAVLDVSPDGKALLTRTHLWGGGFSPSKNTNYLVPLDTLKPKAVGDENDGFAEARLSPDGTRVVGTRRDFFKPKENGVFLFDVKSNTVERVPVTDEVARGISDGSVSWAPDGKRLAVLWGVDAGGKGGFANQRLAVMDADGKNTRTVREFMGDDILRIEWADPKLAADKPAAAPDSRKKNAPVPKVAPPEGVIVLSSFGKDKPIEIVKPDGTPVKVIKPDGWSGSHLARVSRDGKRMLWTDQGSGNATVQFGIPWRIHWLDLEPEKPTAKTIVEDAYLRTAAWSADGKSVYYSRIDPANLPRRGNPFLYETWVFDVAAGKKTPLKLPPEQAVLSTSPDGKTLITRTLRFQTG